jgi:hypothetical protein
VDYARAYAAQRGREVAVSGNFFNLFDQYYAMEPKVDVIITEMRSTSYRQPEWYRYVAGFAAGKPVVVVENPYGGVVPELVARLNAGRGFDLFRMSLYEAAALGAAMSVPYGAWMGSIAQDAFYAPQDLCVEIQSFLADNEHLFGARTLSEVAVVYSVESNFRAAAAREQFADDSTTLARGGDVAFWTVCAQLVASTQPYDVVMFPDGDLRADSLEPSDLARYRVIVLPHCSFLTPRQAALLHGYLEDGGRLVVVGPLGLNAPERARALVGHHNCVTASMTDASSVMDLLGEPQLGAPEGVDMAVNIQQTNAGAALHIVRYSYDEERDQVPDLPRVELDVRLPPGLGAPTVVAPGRSLLPLVHRASDDRHRLVLREVPLYCIVAFREER